MPVPSLLTDLSATIASNSPAGSDNVFPDLDNYLRSLSGFLASIRDNSGNGWVSPYLPLAGGTVTGPATFSSTLALNGALSGTGLTTYLASPPAIGGTAAAAVSSTNLAYTGTLTGGTGVVALGTNQFYKDASGNVGLGTATPNAKLDVVTTGLVSLFGSESVGDAFVGFKYNSTILGYVGNGAGVAGGSAATDFSIGSTGARALTFGTNDFERMRLDASGNLGLGVTPSASTLVTMESEHALLVGRTGANITHNAYYSGSFKYIASNFASRYLQQNGAHQWSTAPSGTAGNAITFTQAMTLDAAGRLGVGVTAPNYTFETAYDAAVTAGSCTALLSAEGGSQGSVGTTTNHALLLKTNNTEKARITSGGDLLVGQVGTGPLNSNSLGMGPGTTGGIDYNHLSGTASGIMYSRFNLNAVTIGSITQSGTTAVLYNTTSDQRLKTNIVDAPEASALIDSIQVRSFDWISDKSHQRYGMVAQELFEVAPEAVHAPADPDEMMAVDYSKLVPMLIKEIQSLRARVAALEA